MLLPNNWANFGFGFLIGEGVKIDLNFAGPGLYTNRNYTQYGGGPGWDEEWFDNSSSVTAEVTATF